MPTEPLNEFDTCFDCGAGTKELEDGIVCPECGWRPVTIAWAGVIRDVEDLNGE